MEGAPRRVEEHGYEAEAGQHHSGRSERRPPRCAQVAGRPPGGVDHAKAEHDLAEGLARGAGEIDRVDEGEKGEIGAEVGPARPQAIHGDVRQATCEVDDHEGEAGEQDDVEGRGLGPLQCLRGALDRLSVDEPGRRLEARLKRCIDPPTVVVGSFGTPSWRRL